ncbi:MAG: hypothetical protein KME31_38415 [Tolypothrix carrinoi HA7290-LM1]|jgi:hypothetical protein|nr:hypothetical protein [Tolypothrix carrinoi HA7290-LM1]
MQLLKQLSIKTKLIVMLLVVSLCAMLASTFTCSTAGRSLLTEKVFNQLTSLRAAKTYQIEDYFQNLYIHSQTLSEDLTVVAAMQELTANWKNQQYQRILTKKLIPTTKHNFSPNWRELARVHPFSHLTRQKQLLPVTYNTTTPSLTPTPLVRNFSLTTQAIAVPTAAFTPATSRFFAI